MKENKINEMIEQIKKIYPNIKIREQPKASLDELLSYEEEYQMNTFEALEKLEELGEEVHFDEKYHYLTKWATEYRIYKIHKGDEGMINKQRKDDEKK